MTSSRLAQLRKYSRLAILIVVGLLGMGTTAWVTREMTFSANDRLEQRFLRDAQERADSIVNAFAEPIKQFVVLQRLFHSVDNVSWPLFESFVEPMLDHVGVRGFGWAPAVDAADREEFEHIGRQLWGADFAIQEMGVEGHFVPAMTRERYYPVLYTLTDGYSRQVVGLDAYAQEKRHALIDQAVDENALTVSNSGIPILERKKSGRVVNVMVPVYYRGSVPLTLSGRRFAVRGMLFVALDVGELFDAANLSATGSGLSASLYDPDNPSQAIHRWLPKESGGQHQDAASDLFYTQSFELARRKLTLRIEAVPSWREANASNAVRYVPFLGALITLLLLFSLHKLLRRSALAYSLEVTHADDLKQRQAAEAWANKLSMAVEQNPATILITDLEGRIEYVNEMFVETTGYSRDEAIGQNARDLMPATTDESPNQPLWASIVAGESWQGELQNKRRDGTLCWDRVRISPIKDRDGTITNCVLIKENISDRRFAEEQLMLAFETIRHSGEGIMVTDAAQRIVSVNPAFEVVTGYRAEEVKGKTPEIIASGRHDDLLAMMGEMLESAGHWQGEVWNRRKNGEVYPEWLGVSVVREADGRPKNYIYIFSDITERKEAQQRIEFLAHHDPLTGLPNRLLLRDRMEHAQAKANRMRSCVAMIYLDLDRFKTINDSLGHPVGDALLKEVVERLKSCVRESDTISRQGGDEFIILLDDVKDSESVLRVVEKIHLRMAEPIVLEGHSLMTSFSMGISLYPEDGEDFDSLLRKADTAMYHAKEDGRNGHRFFTEQMNVQVVEHLTLETQLRHALENNEFVLHYQPQLDLHEGGIIGVEALIRWNSPENGLVSPARFIPVAENSGLIVQIGAWVLREACRQARAWQEAGLEPFVVAVNLSAVQFKRPDLVNTVINALVLSDLDSQWLELELTESILIQDAEATLDSVRRLKALGVKLSVDDFGTGYSSLIYLKRFAVDKLKIDQTFIRDLVTDPDDAAIVRAIIQMAHSLKLKTIAEGVESEELINLLRIFNCDEIQGYWFARPMPAAELETFVRAHQEKRD